MRINMMATPRLTEMVVKQEESDLNLVIKTESTFAILELS